MNNDLISREALKKALKSNCKPELCHDYNTAWCEHCCPHNDFEDLIDNAPTVELTETEVQEVLNKRCITAVANEYLIALHNKTERPKGEWKDHSDEGYVECPFCGSATTCDDNKDELHYCWNCGADMRGGTE